MVFQVWYDYVLRMQGDNVPLIDIRKVRSTLGQR